MTERITATSTLRELLKLSDRDLAELELFDGDPDGRDLWWLLTRKMWLEEEGG